MTTWITQYQVVIHTVGLPNQSTVAYVINDLKTNVNLSNVVYTFLVVSMFLLLYLVYEHSSLDCMYLYLCTPTCSGIGQAIQS